MRLDCPYCRRASVDLARATGDPQAVMSCTEHPEDGVPTSDPLHDALDRSRMGEDMAHEAYEAGKAWQAKYEEACDYVNEYQPRALRAEREREELRDALTKMRRMIRTYGGRDASTMLNDLDNIAHDALTKHDR